MTEQPARPESDTVADRRRRLERFAESLMRVYTAGFGAGQLPAASASSVNRAIFLLTEFLGAEFWLLEAWTLERLREAAHFAESRRNTDALRLDVVAKGDERKSERLANVERRLDGFGALARRLDELDELKRRLDDSGSETVELEEGLIGARGRLDRVEAALGNLAERHDRAMFRLHWPEGWRREPIAFDPVEPVLARLAILERRLTELRGPGSGKRDAVREALDELAAQVDEFSRDLRTVGNRLDALEAEGEGGL